MELASALGSAPHYHLFKTDCIGGRWTEVPLGKHRLKRTPPSYPSLLQHTNNLNSRLYLPMVAAIALPIGLFWFAWTSDQPVHYIVPILSGLPTGMGIAQIMIGLVQYLIDTYTIYCASAIASTVLLRSILGAAFPLVSPPMYKKLGDHWAISIFAFISLACTPIPWLFYVRSVPIASLTHHLILPHTEIWSMDS